MTSAVASASGAGAASEGRVQKGFPDRRARRVLRMTMPSPLRCKALCGIVQTSDLQQSSGSSLRGEGKRIGQLSSITADSDRIVDIGGEVSLAIETRAEDHLHNGKVQDAFALQEVRTSKASCGSVVFTLECPHRWWHSIRRCRQAAGPH